MQTCMTSDLLISHAADYFTKILHKLHSRNSRILLQIKDLTNEVPIHVTENFKGGTKN